MKWLRHRVTPGPSRRSNYFAGMVAAGAISFLYLNFEPAPAGADPAGRTMTASQLAAAIDVAPTPSSQPAPIAAQATQPSQQAASSESDRLVMMVNLMLMEQAVARLQAIPDYTCTFYKQERIGTDLSEGQFMELKMRHKPFSVYMKWLNGEKGRELLYVDGEHENKIVVHPGGWKSRLMPSIKLDPEGSLAMREARHPVTMLGLLNLCGEIIVRRKKEIAESHPVNCRMLDGQIVNERPCYCIEVAFLDRKVSPEYRKSLTYVDKEQYLPVCVKNYAWEEEGQKFADPKAHDEATLVEHYAYSDLQINQQFADNDFSKTNKSYNFRR